MFKSIKSKVDFAQLEEETLGFWDENKIFEKSIGERSDDNTYYFYDGPPFATGLPHYGHLIASTIKDVVPRYQTMLGKKVERRFGWDCHGLPVEFEVEKELGLKGRADILALGIDTFNEKCRSIVLRYSNEWKKTIRRLGRWVDMENDYKTMEVSFMESIWWVFKTLWEKGLIYESKKIVAYSPRLSTPLSNFEVNQGYQDTQDPSVTIKFPVKDQPETYFLAWTTTPWTLISNLGLVVHPGLIYAKVKYKNESYYLVKSLIENILGKDEPVEIVSEHYGRELENMAYEPLFPYFEKHAADGAFRILLGDYVSTETGTGIVHTAPSFGEDDFNTGEKYGLPYVFPMDDSGYFTREAPEFEGMFFKDADKSILRHLKDRGLVLKHESIVHSYPFCWRSGAPLMYRTIGSWFLNVEKIKEEMLDNNQQINWVPEHIKNGRMGKWLEGARDWAISRNRFWGNPIPVWICDTCDYRHCVGSKSELEELANTTLSDLHSHFIDPLTFSCPKCQGTMKRTSEVLDCWFESGSMPYGQQHYPFENREKFDRHFPANFISEGLDQTRGWFYTLLVLSTALFQKPAFMNCIVNGLVLAEDGKKMSKSLKNFPDPWDMLDKYGADVLRLYMLNSGAIRADDLQFSESGLQETVRNTTLPLWNVLSFFTTYANIDNWQPQTADDSKNLPNPLDRWILSRLNHLIADIRKSMDAYDLNKAVAPLFGFIDMLTNWYIRRSRRRFWKAGEGEDKNQAYATLYTVLLELSKAIAPFIPFIAENVYQVLREETMPESVHLCPYPEVDESLIDRELEQEMDIILKSVNMGRALRAKHHLKIRQPLRKIALLTKNDAVQGILGDMSLLITDELNVKEVEIARNEEDLVILTAKPNLRVLGPKFGKKLGDLRPQIEALTPEQIVAVQNGGKVTLSLDGESIELGIDEIFVQRQQKGGIVTESEGEVTVALDIQLDEELIAEGFAREFVNKIQQTRKEQDFDVIDRIDIRFHSNEELKRAIEKHADYIIMETLANSLEYVSQTEDRFVEWMINEIDCSIEVVKSS
ncbi:MAG: isoleucine--tRNA ligase [Proteobacteria bacterium]|nr:isoleucine--tRNA ligase [Pseudomonadota bacterium]